MKKPQLCLNINKRNQRLPELVEELAMEDNLTKVDFIHKIVKEEHRHNALLGVWKQLD